MHRGVLAKFAYPFAFVTALSTPHENFPDCALAVKKQEEERAESPNMQTQFNKQLLLASEMCSDVCRAVVYSVAGGGGGGGGGDGGGLEKPRPSVD